MAILNDLIFNAAFSGCMRGACSGRAAPPGGAALTALVNACAGIAAEVDSLIPWDVLISAAANSPIPLVTGTGAITGHQIGRTQLIEGLCASAFVDRSPTDVIPGDYAVLAAAIVAAYTAGIAVQTVA